MTNEEYVEHEVRLRMHDYQFTSLEKSFDDRFIRLENKMNWIITLVVGGWILPIVMHYLKLV